MHYNPGTVIKAVQYTGSNEAEVAAFVGGIGHFSAVDDDDPCRDIAAAQVWDAMRNRWWPVQPGDWITLGFLPSTQQEGAA